jgi:hypothetical protein
MAGKASLLAVVALAGALAATAAGATSSAAPGWKTYTVPDARMAIDLPTPWRPADYAAIAAQLTAAASKSSAAQVAQLAAKNKLVKFFAYAPSTAPADVVVIRLSGGQTKNLGLLGELSSAAGQLGVTSKGMHLTKASFPAGPATSVTLKTKLSGIEVEEREFVFTRGSDTIEVVFSAPASVYPLYAATFTQAVRTMRFL